MTTLEFGLDTFGDVSRGDDGNLLPHAQVIRNVIEEAVLADQLGIDFIGLGEHHREDFAISAPEVVLAAIAARTTNIRLGSSVTVLSSDDPIRVFQRFSTVDAASNGRAEVILGRGSFTESFALFGFDLRQYEQLFEEKLDLFASLLPQQPLTWQGQLRPPLKNQRVFPPLAHGPLKTWIGVGGSPESVVRAAHYDLPLMLAIIGGEPARFAPYVELYHRAFREFGREAKAIGVHSPGYVAATDQAAREEFWPDYKTMRDRIGRERGWPPMDRLPGDGGPQDRGNGEDTRAFALPAEIFRRPPAPCQADDVHRALRRQGGSAGARHAGLNQGGGKNPETIRPLGPGR
jgi:probable LLM family oxidoreductase